jgi:hypothetical protein
MRVGAPIGPYIYRVHIGPYVGPYIGPFIGGGVGGGVGWVGSGRALYITVIQFSEQRGLDLLL